MLENLITDRTLTDFLRWKELRDKGWADMTTAEREEWAAGMKGAYKHSDLNRVGTALNYLRDRLAEAGYLGGNEFSMPTTWNDTHIPTVESFTSFLSAVETIRAAMSRKLTTPPTPADTGSLDFQGANNIEQILLDVEELINKMLSVRYYSGDLYSGEI